MGISKIIIIFSQSSLKKITALDTPVLPVKSTIPVYLHMNNTLPAVKNGSDCPLTLSEPIPKKGLSVEVLKSRWTNIIGVTRINVLFTTYCI